MIHVTLDDGLLRWGETVDVTEAGLAALPETAGFAPTEKGRAALRLKPRRSVRQPTLPPQPDEWPIDPPFREDES